MTVTIDPSVTPEQERDPRFQKLLRDAEDFFSGSKNDHYKLLLGLHEAGHIFFAKRAGGTNIRRYGPTMYRDSRPQYDCPAISRSAVSFTRNGGSIVANLKVDIAGYIVRRELSDEPNDHIAIEMDLEGARKWFDEQVGTDNEVFNTAVAQADREIVKDLKSQSIVNEIWAEAFLFVNEVFPTTKKSAPRVKTRFTAGRNERCPCGSGKKFKRCHLAA